MLSDLSKITTDDKNIGEMILTREARHHLLRVYALRSNGNFLGIFGEDGLVVMWDSIMNVLEVTLAPYRQPYEMRHKNTSMGYSYLTLLY